MVGFSGGKVSFGRGKDGFGGGGVGIGVMCYLWWQKLLLLL